MNSPTSPRLAGRMSELGKMDIALNEASAGQMRVVALIAEAGVGKSRLISEFTARVQEKALVLRGACFEQLQSALPYAPFTGAIQDLIRQLGKEEVRALVGSHVLTDLSWIMREFGEHSGSMSPEIDRARFFEALRIVLESCAQHQTLVLAFDDIHWADHGTIGLLRFLMTRLQDVPILLIVAHRPEDIARRPDLLTLFADLARFPITTRLRLPNLTPAEVAMQLEGILGSAPPPGTMVRIFRRGNGNPLFTEVLVGYAGDPSQDLPESLNDFLLRNTQHLPASTMSIVRIAALGGPSISQSLLCQITGQGELDIARRLRPAIDAGILVPDRHGYTFRHILIQHAIRSGLLPGERSAFHRAFAHALTEGTQAYDSVWHAGALARHWHGAGDPERAVEWAWRAAREAAAALAYAEQLQMLDLILELWEAVRNPAFVVGANRAEILELAVDAACWAAESDRGLELVEQALREVGDAGPPETTAALLIQRAIMRQHGLIPGELHDLREALSLVPKPSCLRAEILGQMSRALILRDAHESAVPLCDELAVITTVLDDAEYAIESRLVRAHLECTDMAERIERFRETMDLARDGGFGRLEVLAGSGLVQSLFENGAFRQAADIGRNVIQRTDLLGQSRYIGATIGSTLCRSLIALGEIGEASHTFNWMTSLDPLPLGRFETLECEADIALLKGNVGRVTDLLTTLAALPDGPQVAYRRDLVMARLEIERLRAIGERDAALSVARASTSRVAEPRSWLWPFLNVAARIGVDADDQILLHRLRTLANQTPLFGALSKAEAATFDAEVARGTETGHELWLLAVDAWTSLEYPARQSYALMRTGMAAIANDDRRSGVALLRQSAEKATAIGAELMLADVRALAARVRLHLDGDDSPRKSMSAGGLTPRELEVLRLLATGQSNRQIAAELFISPKTASVHVSNILGKLDVPTRAAAVAQAHRRHLIGRS